MYGIAPVSAFRWPQEGPLQTPDSLLDYTYPATNETLKGTDPLTWAAIATRPSGAGELVPTEIVIVGGVNVIVWLQGGVAGRCYTALLKMATQNGRLISRYIRVPIDQTDASWPLAAPPSAGYGAYVAFGITPPNPGALDFSDPANSGLFSSV